MYVYTFCTITIMGWCGGGWISRSMANDKRMGRECESYIFVYDRSWQCIVIHASSTLTTSIRFLAREAVEYRTHDDEPSAHCREFTSLRGWLLFPLYTRTTVAIQPPQPRTMKCRLECPPVTSPPNLLHALFASIYVLFYSAELIIRNFKKIDYFSKLIININKRTLFCIL